MQTDFAASQIPGRPLRYVQKQVQRLYDPRGRKGAWTADEDRELKRYVPLHNGFQRLTVSAHGVHPGEWTKIAAIVDRTEQDCRDRWSKELANSESRHSGQSHLWLGGRGLRNRSMDNGRGRRAARSNCGSQRVHRAGCFITRRTLGSRLCQDEISAKLYPVSYKVVRDIPESRQHC